MVKDKVSKVYYALKIMSIAEVLRLKQTEHVKNEKEILTQVKHPFIINLYAKLMNYKKLIYKLIMALKKKKKKILDVSQREVPLHATRVCMWRRVVQLFTQCRQILERDGHIFRGRNRERTRLSALTLRHLSRSQAREFAHRSPRPRENMRLRLRQESLRSVLFFSLFS